MASEIPFDATLSALLRAQAERHAHAPAILAPGRSPLSYAALWQEAQGIACALAAGATGGPRRVAVMLPNGPELATVCLGVAACAICTPLDTQLQGPELRTYLKASREDLVVILRSEPGPIRDVAADTGIEILEIESDTSLAAGQFHVDAAQTSGAVTGSGITANDVALILHTSGTTARPKIVPLSHANLIASARSIAGRLALGPRDRCLNVMPLFHIHGLVGALLASIASGGSIVCTPKFDARAFFRWIGEFDPTWYTAVPTIHQSVVANGGLYREIAPTHRFRFVRSCSSALPVKTLDALEALTEAPVVEAYGMTEASHEIASNPLTGHRKPGSVGVPSGADVAIMNGTGQLLGMGATGEIVIRGAGVTRGYESDPDADATAFTDGWFRTGDEGRFDEDGYLHISGRLKDIIKRGGETISPREIDDALLAHCDVAQAIAFPVPHPSLGQDIAAAVVLRTGARLNESELRRFLLGRLSIVKVPSSIVFVDAIPTEATGKVQRGALCQKLRPSLPTPDREPQTRMERSLESIFRSVLGCEHIGIHENFFALGGDSLKAAQVVSRVLAEHGVELALPALFAHSTVTELATVVEAAQLAAEDRRNALAAEIEQMSDEEVARLLAEEERDAATPWMHR